MADDLWILESDPLTLFRQAAALASSRKRRLYLVAGCREVGHHFRAPQCLQAIDVAGRYADREADYEELARGTLYLEQPPAAFEYPTSQFDPPPSHRGTAPLNERLGGRQAFDRTAELPLGTTHAQSLRAVSIQIARIACKTSELTAEDVDQAERLIRSVQLGWPGRWLVDCVFGNPFIPVTFDPGWRSETVAELARGICRASAYDRLPILADALEEAGCDNHHILSHCRKESRHVRGCWVIDLITDRN